MRMRRSQLMSSESGASSGRDDSADEDFRAAAADDSTEDDYDSADDAGSSPEDDAGGRRRKFGPKPAPHFAPGSNEVGSANVLPAGPRRRNAPTSASASAPSTSKTSKRTTSKKTTTATKKAGRAQAQEAARKRPRAEERNEELEPQNTKKQKQAQKRAKEQQTQQNKAWRAVVLGLMEDRRGELSPSGLYDLVLGAKLAQTARWFGDLGLEQAQVMVYLCGLNQIFKPPLSAITAGACACAGERPVLEARWGLPALAA